MMRFWMSQEELAAIRWDVGEQLCSPAELGWSHTIALHKKDFFGKAALEKDTPKRRLMGLEWSSDDLAELYAAQFRDAPSAPPPDLPYGQFRVCFLKIEEGGWSSNHVYSPTLRRMISLARVDRDIPPGTKVHVVWGGFSDEPTMRIRATVAPLPFIRQQRTKTLT
jgi:vanillate/3-O-methylgallate O-demethylase